MAIAGSVDGSGSEGSRIVIITVLLVIHIPIIKLLFFIIWHCPVKFWAR